MSEKIEVIIGDSDKIERRLRRIEEQLESLFRIIDSFDDISDVTVALRQNVETLKAIAPETTTEEN